MLYNIYRTIVKATMMKGACKGAQLWHSSEKTIQYYTVFTEQFESNYDGRLQARRVGRLLMAVAKVGSHASTSAAAGAPTIIQPSSAFDRDQHRDQDQDKYQNHIVLQMRWQSQSP